MSTSAAPGFLRGGGEMGELIRAFDWSSTPIGPIQSWSPALRTMVSILLANRFPLLLWWGPHYIQLYNDPYRPIPGTKHPASALGQPASQCWPEIWQVIRPLIDTPFQGGPATWMEDIPLEINRHGFVEETHFTIAYSPVPDESVPSAIGGVLATVHEITDKIVGERRVVALREVGAGVSEAKTAEEACHLAASALATHDKDLPFVLFYLIDAERKQARLAGASGIGMGQAISPLTADLNEGNPGGWPLAKVVRNETAVVMEHLAERFHSVPSGPWSDPPHTAVVLPIRSSKVHHPSGLLVAGISARLKFDEFYRSFLELLAAQVATAIASARAYEEEKKRAEALAEIDRAKTAFFNNVSHEFRTPLTLMLGPIEEELREHPAARPRLQLAHRNTLRLLKLVNRLLDFSRIEAGRIQASYEPSDLAAYTSDLASVFRSAIEKAGLRLIVDCPPLPEPVYVDREMWEKIVLNLLSNAFKFTFEGEIKVALRWRGERVELSVSDTGVGIPESELPRLFERFHRVRRIRARTHEGTGIGLALVKELVGLHAGEVKVQSREGSGTALTVSIQTGTAHLPPERAGAARHLASASLGAGPFAEEALGFLLDDEALKAANEANKQSLPASSSPGAPKLSSEGGAPSVASGDRPLILLADDNADMREYLRRLLAQRYRVEVVGDGQAALERLQAHPPDLVLTDVMMPRLDGFGLLQQLRANERTRAIPVIMLSARAGEEACVEGLGAGADDYLIKPFSARELLARVRSQLEMSRMRRQGEDRLKQILESIADGFYLLDANWRLTYLNVAARRTLAAQGGDAAKLIGKYFWNEVLPNARGSILERELKRAMTERVSVEFENFYGPWQRWYLVRAYPVEEGGLAIYFQDLTEKKHAEETLREGERRVRETNAELAKRVAELQNAQLELQNARRAALNVMEDAVQSRQLAETLNLELRSEITERKQAEEALRLAQAQLAERAGELEAAVAERTAKLQETIGELEHFSYTITHDMRAPLRAMQGFGGMLLGELDGRLTPESTANLNRIMEGARRMDALICDSLQYAKTIREKIPLTRVDPASALRSILETYPALQSPQAEIQLVPPFPPVIANDAGLGQCFSNLLVNAIKFIKPGKVPKVRVWAELRPAAVSPCSPGIEDRAEQPPRTHQSINPSIHESSGAGFVRFWFEDNGIGIAEKYQDRIFVMFQQLDKSYGGTGIGLALVRKTAERMGGKVGVESEPGKGSRFWLEFKCAQC